MKAVKYIAVTMTALWAVGGYAGGDQHEHKHHAVKAHHQQMKAACEGKSDGDEVTVEAHNGEMISAVCKERPATLVAVPQKRVQHFEAMKAACAGKVAGDIVAFDSPRGNNVTGTCTVKHDVLVAVPDRKQSKK